MNMNMGRPGAGRPGADPGPGSGRGSATAAQPAYGQSVTIEEMRRLHQRALGDAEAKRTELRLVLASRYRELVGSSDEVLKMNERAQELHHLVHALPSLIAKMSRSVDAQAEAETLSLDGHDDHVPPPNDALRLVMVRRGLSTIPRAVHRALDRNDVHEAATALMRLFDIIAQHTDLFPLVNALSTCTRTQTLLDLQSSRMLMTQIKMTYLHVQTLPKRIIRLAKRVILGTAADGTSYDNRGAQRAAAAISTINLLDVKQKAQGQSVPVPLLDLYFDSKAKHLLTLLNQLTTTPPRDASKHRNDTLMVETYKTEAILSKIVLILQYDIIVNPFQIFCLRNFPADTPDRLTTVMASMPIFDADVVKSKASHFLAAHLPLIRNKVKSVLVTIAGTTASALGQIRQSLYDKTDGVDCMKRLNDNGVCTWEDAVNAMVDVRVVLTHGNHSGPEPSTKIATGQVPRKFSLWSALFSNTFSSLVHSLLTTSFHSVHARVVSTLRTSLANAPPFSTMLPHEAYRNTLRIATELDVALLKVSDDAHELLVHAEEREESERRLRQSLYVQTCEIMGRLVCELRRMLWCKDKSGSRRADATKEFIVGRLCYLLKFRLTSLPKLLNPKSSPSAMACGSSSAMISLLELQSAFDLADDNDDGLITFEEATEAVDSAFSGTPFHGAEMVRETLLISSKADETPAAPGASPGTSVPANVTLNELALLSARGLRHDEYGSNSALGTIQVSLDDIIQQCFTAWAQVALADSKESFVDRVKDFVEMACTTSELEWNRIYHMQDSAVPIMSKSLEEGNASPHVVGFLLSVSLVLNSSVCPSDSLVPVPSIDYASTLGMHHRNQKHIPTLVDIVRCSLLNMSVEIVAECLDKEVNDGIMVTSSDGDIEMLSRTTLGDSGPSALLQLHSDVMFLNYCFLTRNRYGFDWELQVTHDEAEESISMLKRLKSLTERLVRTSSPRTNHTPFQSLEGKRTPVLDVCDLFFAGLFGDDDSPAPTNDSVGIDVGSSTTPLLHNPLASTRRFVLLPIQNDRALSELQRRGKYGKDKGDRTNIREDSGGSGVIGSGLGFISSMLKKK